MEEQFPAYPTAPLAMLLSVPLVLALFYRLPPYRAAFLSFLGSLLLLPVGYGWTLPGVTFLDKSTLPILTATFACLLTARRELRLARLGGATLFLVASLGIGCFATALTNQDEYVVGGTFLPSLSAWDGVVFFREWAIPLVLPFLLGRLLVRDVSQLERILGAMVLAFLLYSVPMLYEVRMSPQLHRMVYGYFPHQFLQQIRGGGFRPNVFVGHGLPLGILTGFATFASLVLWRRGRSVRGLPPFAVTGYLWVMVALCKTLSAMLYATLGGAVAFFLSAKAQARIAGIVAAIVLSYPLLRTWDWFPTAALTSISESASADRSESLAFRFANEDRLLAHVRDRWVFGWGSYGRNRVFDEDGRDISVTDGLWIIVLTELGAVGFLSLFGLMLLPILQTGRALRNMRSESDRRVVASFALLVALSWADSLPNALSGGIVMVFATGALSGVVASYQRARVPRRQAAKRAIPVGDGFGSPEPLR